MRIFFEKKIYYFIEKKMPAQVSHIIFCFANKNLKSTNLKISFFSSLFIDLFYE